MNLSFKQYKAIDLTILTVVLGVCEFLTAKAANAWFPGQLYVLSPTIMMTCIVMMRWNGFAAIHAAVGGLVFCLSSGATGEQILIYCVGNCFALIALIWFKVFGKKKIKDKFGYTILFTVTAFVGAQLGRWLVGLLLGGAPDSIIVFLTTDCLSLLFAVVVVLISRKADGLFEDQKAYLLRVQAEKKKQEAEDYYNS